MFSHALHDLHDRCLRHCLQMDRGDMGKLLDEICDKVARLTVIQQDTQLQDDAEVIIETAYNTLIKKC